MKLTGEQVRHVANLARLKLSAEEETRFAARLSAILEAVETLAEVDTTDVPPTSWVYNEGRGAEAQSPHTREDVARDQLSTEQALDNAPQSVGTSFAIPRVIE